MTNQPKQQSTDKYISIITSITNVAVSTEPGVASVSCEPGSLIDIIIPSAKSKAGRSIRVDIVGNNVTIDVAINARFGYTIPELVARLQEKLRLEVEQATTYRVKSVNVSIVGVVFSE